MIDICFVGNSSVDHIVTKEGKYEVYGGSAIYSAYSCRCVSNCKISLISNFNKILKDELEKNDISIISNNSPLVEFEIDETKGSCNFHKFYNMDYFETGALNINHLHISFRKGVNVDKILNNPKVKYKTLSMDVMIHSIDEYIPLITKYLNKIDILFCNMSEYSILKDTVKKIPIKIITNEDKPVIVIKENENIIFEVPKNKKIVSTTGAGDSFIGGFLANYIKDKNISSSVVQGISNSFHSIQKVGPLKPDNHILKMKIKEIKLPNNIIVVGNSCAGKTTFIKYLKKYYNIYADIDDLSSLLEVFLMDDISISRDIEEFKKIEPKITLMKEVYDEYLLNFDNINHYSKPSISGNGHDIIRPILWDLILENAVLNLRQENNVIQFSRGIDAKYEGSFGKDVYKRSIERILNVLPNSANTIIINMTSDLEIRKKRNMERHANGGHFVSEETMENVYGQDIFIYENVTDNYGYIKINDISFPVFTIENNKLFKSIELEEFLLYNLSKVIEYYNNFKEE